MKELNLKTFKFPKTSKTVLERCAYIHQRFGDSLKIRAGDQSIPILLLPRADKKYYRIQILSPKTAAMTYETLMMDVENNDQNMPAHIYTVNKNDQLGMSGTSVVRFAVAMLTFLGVEKATLSDVAWAPSTDMPLSMILMLTKSQTMYGRLGFKPAIDAQSYNFASDADLQKKMCKWTDTLQAVHVDHLGAFISSIHASIVSLYARQTGAILDKEIKALCALKKLLSASTEKYATVLEQMQGLRTQPVHGVQVELRRLMYPNDPRVPHEEIELFEANEAYLAELAEAKTFFAKFKKGATVKDMLTKEPKDGTKWLAYVLNKDDHKIDGKVIVNRWRKAYQMLRENVMGLYTVDLTKEPTSTFC